MPQFGIVKIWVEVVTGESRTITAKLHLILSGTGINPARHREMGRPPLGVATTGTNRLFRWNTQLPGNQLAHLFIFIGQIHIAGKARQAARSCKPGVIHDVLL